MGALSDALVVWVQGMNNLKDARTQQEKATAHGTITLGFDAMTAAIAAPQDWDPADRLAWKVLRAFEP